MRTIKFRAWDKKNKEMKQIQLLDFDYMEDGTDILGGYYKQGNKGGVISISDTIIMQFTGLLDKNKKEIYEGDILQYDDLEEETKEVQWNNDYGSWSVDTSGNQRLKDRTVIGNIYENPELLGDGVSP